MRAHGRAAFAFLFVVVLLDMIALGLITPVSRTSWSSSAAGTGRRRPRSTVYRTHRRGDRPAPPGCNAPVTVVLDLAFLPIALLADFAT
jgi:hypothetical protein